MPALTLTIKNKKLQLEFEPHECVLNILNAAAIKISSPCAGQGFCGLCRVKIQNGTVSDLTAIEKHKLSSQQIQQGTRLACQIHALTDISINVENPVDVLKWKKLHRLDKNAMNLQDQYGIAVDLGTTHLRLSLWNIKQQRRAIAWSAFNPQFRFGADVLTRLMMAQNSTSDALELSSLVKQSIKNALQIIAKLPFSPAQIQQVLIVGNTAMLSLFSHKNFLLLLEPEYWTETIDCQIDSLSDWQSFFGLNPHSMIENVPPLAGFVGSDLLAAILATDLMRANECALLIDFGTNSELALWDGEKLWLSSVPGGPAFEGSGISCGMPAGTGAIYHMTEKTSSWDYQMLGQTEPLGLCGSALVDVIAQLLGSHQITRNGRFKNTDHSEYELRLNSKTSLTLKKQDIDIFQRAKAATGAAQTQLLKEASVAISRLQRVCVCGAFGRFLNIEHAQAIGLLPQIPVNRITLHENAALNGCELLLSAPEQMQLSQQVKTQMVNMAHVLDFDEAFVDNLYLQPLAFSK
jgi:uncharacterized 2Fe-2S/4Fe-4S cluster protein (DUF4445 family)